MGHERQPPRSDKPSHLSLAAPTSNIHDPRTRKRPYDAPLKCYGTPRLARHRCWISIVADDGRPWGVVEKGAAHQHAGL
jgi:hypothetical protein